MVYVIKFEYGRTVSGVLPEEYDTIDEAQEQCELENKQYNNVHHFVEEISKGEQVNKKVDFFGIDIMKFDNPSEASELLVEPIHGEKPRLVIPTNVELEQMKKVYGNITRAYDNNEDSNEGDME